MAPSQHIDPAQLSFADVVRFARAFNMSLDDLAATIPDAPPSGPAPASAAKAAPVTPQSGGNHDAPSPPAPADTPKAPAGKQETPSKNEPEQTQKSDGDTTNADADLAGRMQTLEEALGAAKVPQFGDPAALPAAQKFRELPVRDALALIFHRIGAEFLEETLPLEQATPLIDQIAHIRRALAHVEQQMKSDSDQQDQAASPTPNAGRQTASPQQAPRAAPQPNAPEQSKTNDPAAPPQSGAAQESQPGAPAQSKPIVPQPPQLSAGQQSQPDAGQSKPSAQPQPVASQQAQADPSPQAQQGSAQRAQPPTNKPPHSEQQQSQPQAAGDGAAAGQKAADAPASASQMMADEVADGETPHLTHGGMDDGVNTADVIQGEPPPPTQDESRDAVLRRRNQVPAPE